MIIANEERLQKISRIIDAIVFAATTLAIAGVFYEGMTLKWYGPVGIFVVCMDYTFLLATIIHLIADRKEKHVRVHYFSLIVSKFVRGQVFGRQLLYHIEVCGI